MESLAAYRATIRLSGPFPQTRIMEDMTTDLDNSNFTIIIDPRRSNGNGTVFVIFVNVATIVIIGGET
jgi:hypothetical protein